VHKINGTAFVFFGCSACDGRKVKEGGLWSKMEVSGVADKDRER